jgi:gluconokinase
MIVLIIGVAGAGKSTVGKALATESSWQFLEAEDPAGAAASNETVPRSERWLGALNLRLLALQASGIDAVVACTGLSRVQRQTVLEGIHDSVIVFLAAPRDVLLRRTPRAHDTPYAQLVDEQLAELEPPRGGIVVDASQPINDVIAEVQRRLRKRRVNS